MGRHQGRLPRSLDPLASDLVSRSRGVQAGGVPLTAGAARATGAGATFVTGATGFVGRGFLQALPPDPTRELRLLVRDPSHLTIRPSAASIVPGDLVAPDRWAGALAGVDTVVHLAAATGKSTREELFAVNGVATSELVARARDAGVRRFILVSSIAAAFGDRRYYPYAESKLAAEGAVLASGIDVLIVRPTVVLGRGSPTARSLRALAAGPVAVCFGSGQVVTRPIHVSDLARVLVEAVSLPELGNRIVEVGGPETISMERLLRRIREVVRGRTGPLVKIPIVPLRQVLAFVEPVLRPILPFTAGQLASFVNDGRPRQPWPTPFSSPSTGLDVMLSREELGG